MEKVKLPVKIGLLMTLLVLVLAMGYSPAQATDEQRRAYDEMVEQSVKEADEYVQQKQRQHAERHAEQEKAEKRRAEEATEMQEDSEDDGYTRGVIVNTPPAGQRPPGNRPKPTPLPSGN